MNKIKYLLIILCILQTMFFMSGSVFAHEKHSAKPTTPAGSEQKATIPQDEEESEEGTVASGPPVPAPIPFSTPVQEHLHNKIVHFPIALGLAGALFVLLSLKKPEMLTAARILLFLAAAFAVGAYFSGQAQEEPFEHGVKENILEAHENSAIATAISLWVAFFLTLIRRWKGLTVVAAIIVILLVSVAGYYGGLLAH